MQEFKIYFDEILDRKSLPKIELELLTKAEEILKTAYAPYSKFNVGATLLLEDGSYVSGIAVVCCSHPQTLLQQALLPSLWYLRFRLPLFGFL